MRVAELNSNDIDTGLSIYRYIDIVSVQFQSGLYQLSPNYYINKAIIVNIDLLSLLISISISISFSSGPVHTALALIIT